MSQDDPFAEPEDYERTVIRPTPGRRKPAADQTAPPGSAPGPAPEPEAEAEAEETVAPGTRPRRRPQPRPAEGAPPDRAQGQIVPTGINPIVAAAAPILGLAVRLRSRAQTPDVESLRQRVVQAIRGFERRAHAAGATPPAIRSARYALCATVDDLVLNTPWGSRSVWAQQSMVVTFYGEAWGGERFFDVLRQLHQNPGRNFEVLELYYLCLTLGFEGQYRVLDRGMAKHAEIRDGLYRTIRRGRGEFERELSPHWRGVQSGHRPLSSYLPLWVVGVATAALLVLMFLGFRYLLTDDSGAVYAALGGLPPNGQVELARVAPPPEEEEPPPERVAQVEDIVRFLQPEIEEGLVTVLEDAQSITVRLRGTGMFASGSDAVAERFLPTFERLGQALAEQPGAVRVEGHSDDVPVGLTSAFDDNYHLSRDRARSVADLLEDYVDPSRISVEGVGPNEPLEPVDRNRMTPAEIDAARAANRRVEVVLLR
jgi:type VI secretion system protein ImpK